MDWEVIWWIAMLAIVGAGVLWVLAQPKDLYYEGETSKLGGKGGR